MTDEDPGELAWAREQLQAARATPHEQGLVMELLATFRQTLLADPMDGDKWRALDLFGELARGRALETPRDEDWDWAPAKPGQLVLRDRVRVKKDAYGGDAGMAHNGRQGRVIAIRYGDIRVMYEDGGPCPPMGVAHSPHALEKGTKK